MVPQSSNRLFYKVAIGLRGFRDEAEIHSIVKEIKERIALGVCCD